MPTSQYPRDLAKIIHATTGNALSKHINQEALTELIEIAYFTSLKTEELRKINCTLVVLDPQKPHISLPPRIRMNYWGTTKLKTPIPLSGDSLTKLAPAASPSTAWIAIFYNKDIGWHIWGFVDQAIHRHNFLTHESYNGAYRVGGLQLTIDGPGIVSASDGTRRFATLRGPTIHRETADAFEKGAVSRKIDYLADRATPSGPIQLEKVQQSVPLKQMKLAVADKWKSTIRRILIRTRRYGHGGSILFLPDNSRQYLNIKHELKYSRLHESICRSVAADYRKHLTSDKLWEHYNPDQETEVPFSICFNDGEADNFTEDCESEITGCVSLISSLARVDGAVLFGPDMAAVGFGCELLCEQEPPFVYLSSAPTLKSTSLNRAKADQFGTRHRSMIRLCWGRPGSLGFVISQDGAARAVMRVGNRLILWKDIQLERDR